MESLSLIPNVLGQWLQKRLLYIDNTPVEKQEEIKKIDFLVDALLKQESHFHTFERVRKLQMSQSGPNPDLERQIGLELAKVQLKANAIKEKIKSFI